MKQFLGLVMRKSTLIIRKSWIPFLVLLVLTLVVAVSVNYLIVKALYSTEPELAKISIYEKDNPDPVFEIETPAFFIDVEEYCGLYEYNGAFLFYRPGKKPAVFPEDPVSPSDYDGENVEIEINTDNSRRTVIGNFIQIKESRGYLYFMSVSMGGLLHMNGWDEGWPSQRSFGGVSGIGLHNLADFYRYQSIDIRLLEVRKIFSMETVFFLASFVIYIPVILFLLSSIMVPGRESRIEQFVHLKSQPVSLEIFVLSKMITVFICSAGLFLGLVAAYFILLSGPVMGVYSLPLSKAVSGLWAALGTVVPWYVYNWNLMQVVFAIFSLGMLFQCISIVIPRSALPVCLSAPFIAYFVWSTAYNLIHMDGYSISVGIFQLYPTVWFFIWLSAAFGSFFLSRKVLQMRAV